MDVSLWLGQLGLEQYADAFEANAITAEVLPSLRDEHLKELGLPLGHRLKLLGAIAALGSSPDTAQRAPAAAGRDESAAFGAERRQVTVLFADLAGYTGLSADLDPEEVHALLESFFARADHIVAEHGGRVDKHIGDCVMAVFGAPVAHGNDAERALSAALAIRDCMPALSEEVGRPVEVHIGVAGGQVVASGVGSESWREYTVTGETVNLASRLTDTARAGEILVSDSVRREVGARFDGTETGALAVKGFSGTVRAWRLGGPLRPPADGAMPFVGRAAEVRHLGAVLDGCRETGRGQVVHIRGEAGIGKSRLADEVRAMAQRQGFACHTSLVLDFGTGAGRDPLRALVRSLLGLDLAADRQAAARVAEARVADGTIAPQDIPFLNDLLDLPQPQTLRAFFEALDNAERIAGIERVVGRLVGDASRTAPRLVVVEDLHWADAQTLAHLARLAEAVVERPVLLVLTSRIEGDPLDAGWHGRTGGAPLMRIDLGPLRRDEALALASNLAVATERVGELCVERAAGNPLFLVQLLRHAEDSVESGVPGSVQNLVQARVDRLDPGDRDALQAASVLGQRFERDALCHLLDRPDYDLGRLVSRLLVRSEGGGFLFAHALIRDAVYNGLLRRSRRTLHARAAEWYTDRDAILRAEHLERAEHPDAARAFLRAARAQAAAHRHAVAERLTRRGLDLARSVAERSEIACLLGDVLHDGGDMVGAGEAYSRALEAAPDGVAQCRADIGLAAVRRVTEDTAGALDALAAAETLAADHGLTAERARIHFLRGNVLFPQGDWEGCLAEHGAALSFAREAGLPELEAMALGGLGDAEYMRGRLLSAMERFRACIDLCERHGIRRTDAANRPMLAITLWCAGDGRAALAHAERAIEDARQIGHLRAQMVGHHAAWWCRHDLTDFGAAREHAEAALSLSRKIGAHRFAAEALALRAEACRAAGDFAMASADVDEALAISRRTGSGFFGAFILGIRARLEPDRAARLAALAEAEDILRASAVSHNHLLFRRDAIEVHLENGEWDAAERSAMLLEGYIAPEPIPWTTFIIERARALAAFGRGRRDDDLAATLQRLRAEGDRMGFLVLLPPVETALAELRTAS